MEIIDNMEKLSFNNNDNNKNNKNKNKNNKSNTKFIIVFDIEIKIILDKYEKCLVSKIKDMKLKNNQEEDKTKQDKTKQDKTKKGKIYKYKIRHNCDKFLIKMDYNEKEILQCNSDFIFNKTNIKKKLNLKSKDNLVPLFKNKTFYICGLLKILDYRENMPNINSNNLLITNNLYDTEFRLFNKEYMTTKNKIIDYIGEINDKNYEINNKITYKLNILNCMLNNFAYLPKIKIIKLPKPEHNYPIKKIRIH